MRKSKKRVLTKRAVMWLGQTCNLRCYFCYFLNRIEDSQHPEHPFMSLEKAKEICATLRKVYGCTAIDIQGGEPTIYPGILDLIAYCRKIGLYPTLITNGLHLAKDGILEEFRDAGIRDFLCSLHGIGETHDEVVCRKGSYEKITTAIVRMKELQIPFRYNCTMSKPVVVQLPEIAKKAVEYGARAVNFIAFNPFEDQETGIRTHDNVPKYSDIKPYLTEAMDILDEAGIECNVRYLPLCIAEERHRKNFFNLQQLPFDTHEWDYQSWLWSGEQPQRMKSGGLTPPFLLGWRTREFRNQSSHYRDQVEKEPFKTKLQFMLQRTAAGTRQVLRGKTYLMKEEAIERAATDLEYKYAPKCQECSLRKICDGFHCDYAALFGTQEAQPHQNGNLIEDPCYYIQEQEKVIEEEDASWAL